MKDFEDLRDQLATDCGVPKKYLFPVLSAGYECEVITADQMPTWKAKPVEQIIADFRNVTEFIRNGARIRVPHVVPLRWFAYPAGSREKRKKHHETVASMLSISLCEAKDLCARASRPRVVTIYPLNGETP